MGVVGVDPVGAELERLGSVGQQVNGCGAAREVSALDQCPSRTQCEHRFGSPVHPGGVGDGDPGEKPDFFQVGRHHLCQRHQFLAQCRDRCGVQQRVAVLGHRHRVDYQPCDAVPTDTVSSCSDQVGGRQGAGLGGSQTDIGCDRIELVGHDRCRQFVHAMDPDGVLGGGGGDDAGAVHTEFVEGSQIGRNPGAAARIGGRDRHRTPTLLAGLSWR